MLRIASIFMLVAFSFNFAHAHGQSVSCKNGDSSLSIEPLEAKDTSGNTHLAIIKKAESADQFVRVKFLPVGSSMIALDPLLSLNGHRFELKLREFSQSKTEYLDSVLTISTSLPEPEIRTLNCTTHGDFHFTDTCHSKAQSDINQWLFDSSKNSNIDGYRQSLACGAEVNFSGENDCTALLNATDSPGFACRSNVGTNYDSYFFLRSSFIAKDLIERGAYFDVVENMTGETALHKAVRNSEINTVNLLISNDADLNVQDSNGKTPLMIASTGIWRAIEALVKAGADTTLTDKDGKTAYDIGENLPSEFRDLLAPAADEFIISGDSAGKCSPLSLDLPMGKKIKITLKAGRSMFMLSSSAFGINLMASGGNSAHKVIETKTAGEFEFECGTHGGKQYKGVFKVAR